MTAGGTAGDGSERRSHGGDELRGAARGSELLDELEDFMSRFVAFPSEHARVAAVLWAAHTHLMEVWDSTPRLAFLSPEPESGKTRALEVLGLLVPRPVHSVNATTSYIFRKVSDENGLPTILFDEIDTVFGPKAKYHEDLRGLLNAGHRRGAIVGRSVSTSTRGVEVQELPAYCAVALAGLGDLPDTIRSRSVVISMRRRGPADRVEQFRHRVHSREGASLQAELAEWAGSILDVVEGYAPDPPEGVEDRAADVWEPLFAVADAAGGEWPARARVAAVALVAASRGDAPTLGVRLLNDIKNILSAHNSEVIKTALLVAELRDLDESPWRDAGVELDARKLSRLLKDYGITPRSVRIGDSTPKGYRRSDFVDAWSRYLPQSDPASSESGHDAVSRHHPATTATSATCGFGTSGRALSAQSQQEREEVEEILRLTGHQAEI